MTKKIVLGLGNPGKQYEKTYHNAGFMAVHALLSELHGKNETPIVKKHKTQFEYCLVGEVAFVLPLTFMNTSGLAAREALKKFGLKPNDLIVIHDDSDIMIGNYKTSFARNSAGHNGVQSIIDTIGTNAFTRIRIGIRPAKEAQRKKVGEFALKNITVRDLAALKTVFQKITASGLVDESH